MKNLHNVERLAASGKKFFFPRILGREAFFGLNVYDRSSIVMKYQLDLLLLIWILVSYDFLKEHLKSLKDGYFMRK